MRRSSRFVVHEPVYHILVSGGFAANHYDPCVFNEVGADGAQITVVMHLEDIFIVNSPVELNSNLKASEEPYSIVLPVGKVCIENGCNIIVRAAMQNAEAKQARINAAAAREAGRKERVTVEAADSTPDATAGAAPDASSAPKPPKKGTSTRFVCLYQL
jgi:hypothetical protein